VDEAELLRIELRDCLVRVGSVLARAEDALGKLQVAPLLPKLQVSSGAEGVACLYGDFSPRVTPPRSEVIVEVVAPILQIMPELQELSGEPSIVLSMEMGSLGALEVAMTPSAPSLESCQPLPFVDRGGQVVSLIDEVNEVEVSTPNSEAPLSMVHPEVDLLGSLVVVSTPSSLEPSESLGFADSDALFAKELCDLLASLEAASPGSSKEIARLLSMKDSWDKIEKVKEYLKSKSKKYGTTRKVSQAA
jgi:hypothetical protein